VRAHIIIRHSGVILSTITEPWKYSGDLPQGGLELPCMYVTIYWTRHGNKEGTSIVTLLGKVLGFSHLK